MFLIKSANPNRILFRGIITIVVGMTIVSVPGLTLKLAVQLLGGLLLVDGLVAWLTAHSKNDTKGFYLIPRGVSNIVAGIVLLSFPMFMVGILVSLIGIVLVLAGGSMLAKQIGGGNRLGFSWMVTIISVITLITGIVLLTKTIESAESVLTVFGVIISLYGIGEIIWSFKIRKYQKQHPSEESSVVDADYEEVGPTEIKDGE